MKMMTRWLISGSLAMVPVWANAATPTLGEVLDASGINVSGYVDTSYTYSAQGKTTGRIFDTQPNSFNVNMLGLSISKLPTKGFGGAVVLNAGPDADVTASGGTGNTDEFDVQQAYVNYASGNSSVMFGKFATLDGAEVIESKDNLNFSRSILFGYAIPFTHTGVRVSYANGGAWSFIAGINNGWDNLKDDNKSKSLELHASYAPSDVWNVSVQTMSGDEQVNGYGTTGPQGNRTLLDIVATLNASDNLSFVLNIDSGSQENAVGGNSKATWSGAAFYANYVVSSKWRTAARIESFDDKDGYRTGSVQKWKEATLTLAYTSSKNVELRGEVRRDSSDKAFFAQDNGTMRKTQNTLAFEAIYKF